MRHRFVGRHGRPAALLLTAVALVVTLAGCSSWKGLNGLPLPGPGTGQATYQITVELPNAMGIERNSRVLLDDVTVGSVRDVRLDGWRARITANINRGVVIPGNALARIGQTSLLGTLHLGFSVPAGQVPTGQVAPGDTVPLQRAGAYPSTEETLTAVSVVLNGGGFGELGDLEREVGLALQGSQGTNRALLRNLADYTTSLSAQTGKIIAALDQTNRFAGMIAAQRPILDNALQQIPAAVTLLSDRRAALIAATTAVGTLADNAQQIVSRSAGDIGANLQNLQTVLAALASSGRDLTQSLNLLATYPWPENGVRKFIRGDYANLSATIDLTLSRLDQGLLGGTPLAGSWTALEAAMGRKTGIMPFNNHPLAVTGGTP